MKRWADTVFSAGPRPPLPAPPAIVGRALEPLVLPERLARIERAVAQRIGSVAVVVESLADPHNVSAILRTADGLGIQYVHAIETHAHVLMTTRVTKGCEKWLDLRRYATVAAAVATLRAAGFVLYVADARATQPLDAVAAIPRVALAFGNEHDGVSSELRAAASGSFCVPMRGMVESFNVSVAAGIALAAVAQNRSGDIDGEVALELRARFLIESVRGAEHVIERYVRDTSTGVPSCPSA